MGVHLFDPFRVGPPRGCRLVGAFWLVLLEPLDVGSAQTHRAGSESDGVEQSASAPPVDGVGLHLQFCGCLADGDQVGSVFGPGLDNADRAALQGDCATFRRVDDDVRAHAASSPRVRAVVVRLSSALR